MSAQTAELIERREYKYLVDDTTVGRIREAVRPFCNLDTFGEGQPNNRYTIDSCYFDTPKLDLYHANKVELPDRFKLRVRTYPSCTGGPVFFEVKRRANDVISKTRGCVPRALWAKLLTEPITEIPSSISKKNRPAVERFIALVNTYHARPTTVVRYEREAYVSTIDDYARVTFDCNVRSQARDHLTFPEGEDGWRYMDSALMQKNVHRKTLVELKFTSTVPSWMVNIVQRLNLSRRSFSKYGTSIRAWYQKPTVRTPSGVSW